MNDTDQIALEQGEVAGTVTLAGLRKAAQGFEALFLRQVIGSMRQAKLGDDLFGSSATNLPTGIAVLATRISFFGVSTGWAIAAGLSAAVAWLGDCTVRTRKTAPIAAAAATSRMISRIGDMNALRQSPPGLRGPILRPADFHVGSKGELKRSGAPR